MTGEENFDNSLAHFKAGIKYVELHHSNNEDASLPPIIEHIREQLMAQKILTEFSCLTIAIAEFTLAIRDNPNIAEAYLNRAVCQEYIIQEGLRTGDHSTLNNIQSGQIKGVPKDLSVQKDFLAAATLGSKQAQDYVKRHRLTT